MTFSIHKLYNIYVENKNIRLFMYLCFDIRNNY